MASKQSRLSRRSLLVAGAAATGAALAACASGEETGTETSTDGTNVGGAVELTAAIIPDPPGATEFYRAQFDAFEAANPGVTVNVVENPADTQLQAIELMFQQGNAPDIFRAQGVGFDRMYERGWVRSLEEFVTDDFLARFPQGSMNPQTSGIHRDGELHALPLVWSKWGTTHVFVCNMDLLTASGFDAPPATWSELEEIARKVTADGGGGVFGYATQGSSGISRIATQGVPYSIGDDGIDLRTGLPANSDPTFVEIVELHRRLSADRIMIPGWESWDSARAYTEFAAGTVAMYATATWHVAEIRKLAPEMNMAIVSPPVPDAGRGSLSPLKQSFDPLWEMSAETEHAEEAWKLLDWLSTPEFHLAYYQEFGSLTAIESAWEDAARDDPDQAAIIDVANESLALVPNPRLASPGGMAILTQRADRPELRYGDAALESLINNEPFAPKAEELDRQLAEFLQGVYDSGAATAADITFPDWDPVQPYTPGD